jgi:hypothetical protein
MLGTCDAIKARANWKGETIMFVRVLNFVCREDTQKEQIQQVYRLVIERAQEIEGFVGSTLLMQQDACNGMALMYWQSEEAAAQAGPFLVEILGEYIHDLLDTPPEVAGYYVVENEIVPNNPM